jgi:chemotaxis methyl-accepting protein methylase
MARSPFTPEVKAAVQTVYGENGLERCLQLAKHSRLSEAELLVQYRASPTPAYTYFFRESPTIERLSAKVPDLVPKGQTLRMRQVGGSLEAWTIAAYLKNHIRFLKGEERSFAIESYDVSPGVIDYSHGPFNESFDRAIRYQGKWIGRYFAKDERGRVVPCPNLHEHVSFCQQDVITQPFPDDPVDALAMFNILWHYPADTRNHILAHTLRLKPGGLFLYEGWTRDSDQAPGYRDWINGLEMYGLVGSQDGFGRILQYRPEWARQTFETSPAVGDALGVLATAQQVLGRG